MEDSLSQDPQDPVLEVVGNSIIQEVDASNEELPSTVTVNPGGGDEKIINRSLDVSKDNGASKDCDVSSGRGVSGDCNVSKNPEVSNNSDDYKNQNNENK
ncbi:unnamed protein product [Lepeophtheirus salmonis]|uniref:(salmon louse) hypothetical protein n=1 Tax=Lepeophtheirus salmonis TaxID=72036 RepID=A0A7R8D2S4_LEPSM|nr:unnamed protein product [Lepeophtheirus salmonis]CAF3008201.1 unnamed protein product [Lepeophtheirus salmonis]